MKDPRIETLAKQLIHYSLAMKEGESLLIENFGADKELITSLVQECYSAGAKPSVWSHDKAVDRALMMNATAEKWDEEAARDGAFMKQMQAYIGVRGGDNGYETADVPPEQMKLYMAHYSKKVHGEIRVPHTRWVVLRYPTPSMAQLAETSTEAFEDFYFQVCNLDYNKMSKAMDALVTRLNRTDKVHILGKGTDLRFSVKDIPAVKCDGHMNIPDGEVYTAPVRNSVNGVLQYNTPSLYQGNVFNDMRLTFKDGKIVEAVSSDTERCNRIFDTDEGARFVGEFAIGVNPYVTKAMKDTLFDEKIAGSFHFTPGQCYDECPNGNHSAIHWDLVCIQTPEYGGGEMYFDDELVRKDGLFVTDDLKGLNPENLM